MAVYTEVSEAELGALAASYELGAVVSYKGITEGVENTNYLVVTTMGRYILTLYEKRVDPAELPFFLELMEHLAARGLNCPVPLRDRDGHNLREIAGRPAAFVTFLEGGWIRQPSATHCAAVGEALARLHLAGNDFGMRRVNGLGQHAWRPLFGKFESRAEEIATGLAGVIGEELSHHDAHWPRGLPEGVIHADLFPDNVFFLDGALSGLIDFYFACTDALAYDVAVCINAWCFEPDFSFNKEKGRALLGGYQRVRRLTDREVSALPVLARGAALRFLLTRAYDWINTPPDALVQRKDPGEYLARLSFHKRVSQAADYGLEAQG